MKNNFLIAIFVLLLTTTFAQKSIQGKIVVKDGISSGILVLNLVSEKETISKIDGTFSIEVKIDDLLVFQSESLEYYRKSIDEDDFKNGYINIEMIKKPIQLEEIKIFNYSRINAVSMGILSKPAKSYTPAERKLKTATSFDPQFNIGTMAGFGLSLDPIFNAISGRTKMLKRFVAVEKVQLRIKRLENWFSNEYFINNLQIKETNLKSFVFYAAEDQKVINGIALKNKIRTSFALIETAKQYNAINH